MDEFLKDYGKKVDWNVGSLFAHDAFMQRLLDLCKELNVDVPIKYVFGSIPCIMQGGRIPPRDADIKDAFNILDEYNKRGVGCRLTFSNTLLEEKDLDDELSNALLDHLNNSEYKGNGVIVSSDLLARYIREKYPNLEIISSLVKPSVEVGLGNDEVEYYNALLDLYDIVVVNPFKVNDGSFLNTIKDKDRIEFISNHRCLPNCPMAKAHYESQMRIGMKALKGEVYDDDMRELCSINSSCIHNRKKYPMAGTSLSYVDMEMLVRMGFKHFKIEGRDNSGECFIRDLGEYIFNYNLYSRMIHAIMEHPV